MGSIFDFFNKKEKIEICDTESTSEKNHKLFSALAEDNYSEIKILIKEGVNVSALNETGITPLIYCVLNNKIKTLEFLLANKADPKIIDVLGKTPFNYACQMGNVKMAKIILKKSSLKYETEKDPKIIFHAINENMGEMISFLIKLGVSLNEVNHLGYTPLMCTIFRGNIKAAIEIMDHDADVNIKSNNGKTALMYAVEIGNKWLIKTIIDKGGDINAVDNSGDTIRDYVKRTDNRELLHFFDYYIKTIHRI